MTIRNLLIFPVLTMCTFALLADVEEGMDKALRGLESEDAASRADAAKVIREDHERTVQRIEDIVRNLASKPDRKGSVKSAMLVLGELRAERSVPLLVEHLTLEVFYKDTKRPQTVEDRFPAVKALVRIGLPAVEPLLTRIVQTEDDTTILCAATIFEGIYGRDLAVARINKRLVGVDGAERGRLTRLANKVQGG